MSKTKKTNGAIVRTGERGLRTALSKTLGALSRVISERDEAQATIARLTEERDAARIRANHLAGRIPTLEPAALEIKFGRALRAYADMDLCFRRLLGAVAAGEDLETLRARIVDEGGEAAHAHRWGAQCIRHIEREIGQIQATVEGRPVGRINHPSDRAEVKS